jgi:hypothetical protein
VTPQDPDIAALTARLGLRGLQYRSFGNRPMSAVPAQPPQAPAPVPVAQAATPAPLPQAAPPAPPTPPAWAPAAPAWPATTMAPPAPPQPMDFPLIAATLRSVAAPATPAATDGTLVFLGRRAATAAPGR